MPSLLSAHCLCILPHAASIASALPPSLPPHRANHRQIKMSQSTLLPFPSLTRPSRLDFPISRSTPLNGPPHHDSTVSFAHCKLGQTVFSALDPMLFAGLNVFDLHSITDLCAPLQVDSRLHFTAVLCLLPGLDFYSLPIPCRIKFVLIMPISHVKTNICAFLHGDTRFDS
ncbi:hypothetical protein B0H11DRAFT_1931365 [Mycena galericulata]|nr:hypothetical protein B0H11DRAFT_1931365 [Mycena galericulata]